MKNLLLILVGLGVASGLEFDDLRVRYEFNHSADLGNKEYFFELPRTIEEAKGQGWRETNRPPGYRMELPMYCSSEYFLCLLYHPSSEFVCGLQYAFPVEGLFIAVYKPEKWFVKWEVPACDNEPAIQRWALTQYWIPPDSSAEYTIPQKNGSTLQNGGIWVDGPDGKPMFVPSVETELQKTNFTKQNCVNSMGTHYHFNMTSKMLCENQLPWFVLTKEGYVIGFGLQFFGNITETPPKKKNYFETFNGSIIERRAIPLGPDCIYQNADTYDIFSSHMYCVRQPWDITCGPEDSIEPPETQY